VDLGGEKAEGGDIEKDKCRGLAFATRECLVGPSTIALLGSPVDCGLYRINQEKARVLLPEMFVKLFENFLES